MSSQRSAAKPLRHVVLLAAAGLLLAGCEGKVTVDLATEAPVNPDLTEVVAPVAGLQFLKSDDTTESVLFSDSEYVDFMDLMSGVSLRMLTAEELPEGDYDGVRLVFDEDLAGNAYVRDVDGNDAVLALEDGDYVAIDFTVEEDDNSTESLTLTMGLRQSLVFVSDDDGYSLTPVLRSVTTTEAGTISGTVDIDCDSDISLADDGAVYLFQEHDIEPDDQDGIGVDPYASSPLVQDTSGLFNYTLRNLPQGDYTIAATCEGSAEDPASDDALTFQGTANLQLDEAESLNYDID